MRSLYVNNIGSTIIDIDGRKWEKWEEKNTKLLCNSKSTFPTAAKWISSWLVLLLNTQVFLTPYRSWRSITHHFAHHQRRKSAHKRCALPFKLFTFKLYESKALVKMFVFEGRRHFFYIFSGLYFIFSFFEVFFSIPLTSESSKERPLNIWKIHYCCNCITQ